MKVQWKLRMAAAQREVWTGADLRRLLWERAGLPLSAASVSALMTRQPSQVKLSTLAALCTALECSPNDLFEIDTTPVAVAKPVKAKQVAATAVRGRSMPPLRDSATVFVVAGGPAERTASYAIAVGPMTEKLLDERSARRAVSCCGC